MPKLGIIYLLITAVLTAIAIYVQVKSSTLSFPISAGTTILTILLPLVAAVNFFFTPILHRVIRRNGASYLEQLVLPGLQILQGVLTVILITLSFQGFLPGQSLRCNIESNWQRLWSSHDGRGIERIQDAFSCCGLNSIKDRAWPKDQCSQLYSRHIPCAGPWMNSMQRNSGFEFAVATAVGILQLVQLVLFRLGSPRGNGAVIYKRISQDENAGQVEALLDDDDADDASVSRGASGDGNDTNRPRLAYGATDAGNNSPRVEPSHLGEDRNLWVS